MFARRPCTSTTGRGCAALGWQDQSFAPGGGAPCAVASATTLARNVYGTGYCGSALAGAAISATAHTAAANAAILDNGRMTRSLRAPPGAPAAVCTDFGLGLCTRNGRPC